MLTTAIDLYVYAPLQLTSAYVAIGQGRVEDVESDRRLGALKHYDSGDAPERQVVKEMRVDHKLSQ